jgi:SAM-dependent methyltransferase
MNGARAGNEPGVKTAQWTLPFDFDGSANPFRDKFGHLSADDWCQVLIAAATSPVVEGLEFPHLAPEAVQERTHGTTGVTALTEAAEFYKFVAAKAFFRQKAVPGAGFLDFGTGWGRIARLFLRDFDLKCQFAFEPRSTSCFLARTLNPYLCVLPGDEMPDQTLPTRRFDLVVGWSVFSHLSEGAATAWLEELARVMRPDGYCVLSTFGDRFLNQLITCQSDLQRGKEIHWYHQRCLDVAGDIAELQKRYLRGDFVWLGNVPTKYYGEATLLHDQALLTILRKREIPFQLVEFDRTSLGMDMFTLRRQ